MSKNVQIEYVTVRTPKIIKVDNVTYPRNQRNLDVVGEYVRTGDDTVLDKLVNFSIEF